MAKITNYLFAKQNLHFFSRNIKESHECESDISNNKLLLEGHTQAGLVLYQGYVPAKDTQIKIAQIKLKIPI